MQLRFVLSLLEFAPQNFYMHLATGLLPGLAVCVSAGSLPALNIVLDSDCVLRTLVVSDSAVTLGAAWLSSSPVIAPNFVCRLKTCGHECSLFLWVGKFCHHRSTSLPFKAEAFLHVHCGFLGISAIVRRTNRQAASRFFIFVSY